MEWKYENSSPFAGAQNLEDELSDLKQELEHFQREKERVRAIIGKISGEGLRLLMIELATVTLSAKIIYMIHLQMRINHFQFWILSSIEWRINEAIKHTKEL
jgi:hypothetical protein